MINFEDPYISVIETDSDFEKIGEWTVNDMGLNPFFYLFYRGEDLPKFSKTLC